MCTVSVVLCLIPFIHIIAVSLSGTTPITSGKVSLWPLEANMEAYKKVFTNRAMIRSLGFTILDGTKYGIEYDHDHRRRVPIIEERA